MATAAIEVPEYVREAATRLGNRAMAAGSMAV
jgi:hypothetical protein